MLLVYSNSRCFISICFSPFHEVKEFCFLLFSCKDFWSDQSHGTYGLVTPHFYLENTFTSWPRFPSCSSKPKQSRSLSDSPEVATLQTHNIQARTYGRVRKDKSSIPKCNKAVRTHLKRPDDCEMARTRRREPEKRVKDGVKTSR